MLNCRCLEAMESDERGILWGIPFAVKDNIDVGGVLTTCACPEFGYIAASSAPVVRAVVDAGGVFMGKTNLDQFACGLVGTRSPYGVPENAFHKSLVPGGSSSGSAVAVAAGMVTFALGTDTAGSGRVPAGNNGIVGMKPTVGLCSTKGVVPACRTLDCPSVFALTVEDGRTVLSLMENEDKYDPTWKPKIQESYIRSLNDSFKFGVPSDEYLKFDGPGGDSVKSAMTTEMANAVDRVKSNGGEMIDIDFEPFQKIASLLYEGAFVAERYQGIQSFLEKEKTVIPGTVLDVSQDTRLLPVTRTIINNTKNWTASDVYGCLDRLDTLKASARQELDKIDVLLVPTAAYNYTVKEITEQEGSGSVGYNANLGRFTNFVNQIGMCGVSVPSGVFSSSLVGRQDSPEGGKDVIIPFGVTVLGKGWEDKFVGQIAEMYFTATGLGPGPKGHDVI